MAFFFLRVNLLFFKSFRSWSYTSDLIFKMVDQASHLKEA